MPKRQTLVLAGCTQSYFLFPQLRRLQAHKQTSSPGPLSEAPAQEARLQPGPGRGPWAGSYRALARLGFLFPLSWTVIGPTFPQQWVSQHEHSLLNVLTHLTLIVPMIPTITLGAKPGQFIASIFQLRKIQNDHSRVRPCVSCRGRA